MAKKNSRKKEERARREKELDALMCQGMDSINRLLSPEEQEKFYKRLLEKVEKDKREGKIPAEQEFDKNFDRLKIKGLSIIRKLKGKSNG